MRRALAAGLGLWLPAAAAQWQFDEPLELTDLEAAPHFHHLDGAARRHLATSDGAAAITWEDDSSGDPQVYVTILAANAVAARHRLSDGDEAYEPVIAALGDGRWLVAFEQDGAVLARIVDERSAGPPSQLAPDARQVSLASDGERVAAVWAKPVPGGQVLEAVDLAVDGDTVAPRDTPMAVTPAPDDHPYQGYPSALFGPGGRLLVAWEDRRAGHTRLFHSHRAADGGFAAERQLNEHNEPPPDQQVEGGLGSGVMRVALAADGAGRVRAAWLDKRNPNSGYAVWGALSDDGGLTFGPNRIVQDELGGSVPQWHAALSGAGRRFVAAWDDTREAWGDDSETGDVLLSWNDGEGWSGDLVVPVASGPGYQGSPAVALDADGVLHLAWIARDDLRAPSRLYYTRGVPR